MKRLEEKFKERKKIISVFFTAGYPTLGNITELCLLLQTAGADMIEIGIPSSDPLADGPVIQHSSTIALKNGFTIKSLFEELIEFRKKITIPVLLMGYYNQVLQFGPDKFIKYSKDCGIDGFIIPDQPEESTFASACVSNSLANVRLVCPTSSVERILFLDKLSSGFLYAVSSSSTTGNLNKINSFSKQKFTELNLLNKVLTGFGIHDKVSFHEATSFSNGGIIGTAFIKLISNPENISQDKINSFINQFK